MIFEGGKKTRLLIAPLEGFHLQQLTSSEKINANCSPTPHRPEIRAPEQFTHVACAIPLRENSHKHHSYSTLQVGCGERKGFIHFFSHSNYVGV